jgi:hypothetical protein
LISSERKIVEEINNRVSVAGRIYYRLDQKFITYGYESWALSSKHNSQMKATEIRYLRKIEGKTTGEKISNRIIRMGLGITPLKEMTE